MTAKAVIRAADQAAPANSATLQEKIKLFAQMTSWRHIRAVYHAAPLTEPCSGENRIEAEWHLIKAAPASRAN